MAAISTQDKVLEALFKFQDECPLVKPTDVNPHFKNRYASLKAIKLQIAEHLAHNKLRILQRPILIDNTAVIRTSLYHTESKQTLDLGDTKLAYKDDNPQSLGSANTYARRFGIVTGLDLLVDADDDGQAAETLKAESTKRNVAEAINKIENASSLDELKDIFASFEKLKANKKVFDAKEKRKAELSEGSQVTTE